jgi:phosphatidylserine decarboxylase
VITRLPPRDVELAAGAELGRFNMGSTVILLFESRRVAWEADLRRGAVLRQGARIGTWQ